MPKLANLCLLIFYNHTAKELSHTIFYLIKHQVGMREQLGICHHRPRLLQSSVCKDQEEATKSLTSLFVPITFNLLLLCCSHLSSRSSRSSRQSTHARIVFKTLSNGKLLLTMFISALYMANGHSRSRFSDEAS